MNRLKVLTNLMICFLLLKASSLFAFETSDYICSPSEGTITENRQTSISFNFGSTSFLASSLKVVLNNTDITQKCPIVCHSFFYCPVEDLPVGMNRVEVFYKDKEGKYHKYTWTFKITEPTLIQSVKHNCTAPLMEKEKLIVTMKGKPGGKASFSIGETIRNIQMNEVKPGEYSGTYVVQKGDYVSEEHVKVDLKTREGGSQSVLSEKPVIIFAQFFKIKLITPKDGDKVCQRFFIKGRTKPNVKVMISISLTFKKFSGIISAKGPDTGGIETVSDSNGYFEKEMGFPISFEGLKASLKVIAIDEKGDKSMPEEITVFLDTQKDKAEKEKKKNGKAGANYESSGEECKINE